MKVYVLSICYNWEAGMIFGVYSSLEKALEQKNRMEADPDGYVRGDRREIEVFELDEQIFEA
jgi:hypothetical protein